MAKRKSTAEQSPGYRELDAASEQRYWDCHRPNFREWVLKNRLTVDEASALVMGLDPSCLEDISGEHPTYERFLATKAWFTRNRETFPNEKITLEGIFVCGNDCGDDNLSMPYAIMEAVDLMQIGFLTIDKKVKRLERQIEKLKTENGALRDRLAKAITSTPKKAARNSDKTNSERTSSKIIVALMAECIGAETDYRKQFVKIKNGQRSVGIISRAASAVRELGWKIEEDSILSRFRQALTDWDPNESDAGI